MAMLLAAPPAAAAELDVAALVPVPEILPVPVEVAALVALAPPDELELDPPPQAATPSARAAALRSRADCLNMAEISLCVSLPGWMVQPRCAAGAARRELGRPRPRFLPRRGLLGCYGHRAK